MKTSNGKPLAASSLWVWPNAPFVSDEVCNYCVNLVRHLRIGDRLCERAYLQGAPAKL
jgi:hypothetical protein